MVLEERSLGAGEVVLGESGDLVEQEAAPVVVEPHRGQPFVLGAQAGAYVVLQGDAKVVRAQVDVHGRGGGGPACRGREEIAVCGADVVQRRDAAAAAQHVLVHHEFSVVLTDSPGGGT